VVSILIYFVNPVAFSSAAPFLILWLLSPAFAWILSNPEKDDLIELPEEQTDFLHKTARKTWSFFERFVNEEGNWLPPDNYQEHPVAIVAYRTSPTNLGLNLLANLSAHDFGYITSGALLSRCDNSLQSMLKLERFKGHFYNWYDTLTLVPLNPRYISTVDSGNLAGHLLVLRQGLISLRDQPVISKKYFEGLKTTALIIKDFSKDYYDDSVDKIIALIDEGINDTLTLSEVNTLLNKLSLLTGTTEKSVEGSNRKYVESEKSKWNKNLSKQILEAKEFLMELMPWIDFLPIPEHFQEFQFLNKIPTHQELQQLNDILTPLFDFYQQKEQIPEHLEWIHKMRILISEGGARADKLIQDTIRLGNYCEQLSDIEYDFLFNASTSLFRIGYNVDEQRADNSYYDLLASEARLGVFVAIAQGKIPQESWFALGRLLTNSGGDPILLSWSGSMFEYLMPQLVMPAYDNTLLFQTSKIAVKRQIDYGMQQNIPWGISESGYNLTDANLNYQYRAFGVPGLGLKRGLEDDLVVAPYASMLALMVSPGKACSNLQMMREEGFEGAFGFYEAIDYTRNRLPRGKEYSIVQSYMVHHQGMGLLALAYTLLNKPMQQRFVAELRFQSTLLLLQ
ncbi:MAG TPA: glucoamylase family protein, partial [Bacteroidia bacterium]|nr:glucoamylase family protein [Bacteroidia bacterium]